MYGAENPNDSKPNTIPLAPTNPSKLTGKPAVNPNVFTLRGNTCSWYSADCERNKPSDGTETIRTFLPSPRKIAAASTNVETSEPDAHGGAYPQVALMVFDDAAHLLSLQNFGVRESKGLVVLSVEKIESFFRSDNHIAVLSFADAIRLSVFQNVIPSEVLEAECLRVEAGNAI